MLLRIRAWQTGRVLSVLSVGVLGLSGPAALAATPQYQITPLTTSFGLYDSVVRAINNNGLTVGYSSTFPQIQLPNGSGYTDGRGVVIVGNSPWRPDEVRGTGIDVNDSGQIIGTRFVGGSDTASHPFFYDGANIVDLTTLGVPADATLAALNNAGTIVGTRDTPSGGTAVFTVSNGVVTDLNLAPAPYGQPYASGINNAGVIVGNIAPLTSSNPYGFFYDGTTLTTLALNATANGINDSGQIVGTRDELHTPVAFVFQNGTYTDLGTLPGFAGSTATAINNAGQVVGVAVGRPGAGDAAFLFSDGAMHDLNSLLANGAGWDLSIATGINDRGQIIGFGYYNGQRIPYLATPVATTAVPLPAAATPALITMAGLAAAGAIRRRQSARVA